MGELANDGRGRQEDIEREASRSVLLELFPATVTVKLQSGLEPAAWTVVVCSQESDSRGTRPQGAQPAASAALMRSTSSSSTMSALAYGI